MWNGEYCKCLLNFCYVLQHEAAYKSFSSYCCRDVYMSVYVSVYFALW